MEDKARSCVEEFRTPSECSAAFGLFSHLRQGRAVRPHAVLQQARNRDRVLVRLGVGPADIEAVASRQSVVERDQSVDDGDTAGDGRFHVTARPHREVRHVSRLPLAPFLENAAPTRFREAAQALPEHDLGPADAMPRRPMPPYRLCVMRGEVWDERAVVPVKEQ